MNENKKNSENKIYGDEKIEELLSPKSQADLKIEKALLGLNENFNLLVLVNEVNYPSTIMTIMRRFSKQPDRLIIYITANKPFEKLKSELLSENIDLKHTMFVDTVTSIVGARKITDKNVNYLPSTANLNDLMQAIEEHIQKKAKEKLVIFDSISTMLVYHDFAPIEKMLHALIGKLGKFKVSGVFFMTKSQEHSNVIQTIGQFCDKVVEMEKL